MLLIPDGTQRGVERVLLPEQDASEPPLTCFMNRLPARHPASPALALQTPAGVFLNGLILNWKLVGELLYFLPPCDVIAGYTFAQMLAQQE
jgi:hypothetical protein